MAYEQGDDEAVQTLRLEIHNELRGRGPYLFQRRDLPIDVGDPIPGADYPFYSKVGRVVASFKPGQKIGASELKGRLKSAQIQDEEIAQAQLDKFLEGKKSVTREETLAWLDENFLTLEENIRYHHPPRHITDALGEEPGGTLHSPTGSKSKWGDSRWTWSGSADPAAEYGEISIRLPTERYGQQYLVPEGHFPTEHNTLGHIRFTTRPVNGKKMLLLEEIQSDWYTTGSREGWATPLEDEPRYQELVAAGEGFRQEVEQATEKVNELGDWYWGERTGPETLGDMPAPTGTLGIERALGINLSDDRSLDVFQTNLSRIKQARDANRQGMASYRHTTGAGDFGFELRPDYYNEGIEIGFTFPYDRGGWVEQGGGGQPRVDEDWQVVRSGLSDRDHYDYAGSGYWGESPEAKTQARIANERAASSELSAWSKLMEMPDQAFDELLLRVTEANQALVRQRQANQALRDYTWRNSGRVQPMPFSTPDTWHELVFKRMLAWAVDNGFEKVGWLTGEHQAKRYELANFFERMEVTPSNAKPDVGSDEYYDALEASRNTQEYYDYIGEDLPREPMEGEFREAAEDALDDTRPQSHNYDDMDEYYDALQEWEDDVSVKEEELYDEAYADWESERDSAEESAMESWDNHFADTWADRADYGYGYDSEGWEITANRLDGGDDLHEVIQDHQLEDYIGRDMAERVRDGESLFEGEALAVGGGGEQGAHKAYEAQVFYDKKLRNFVSKYMKRWGTQPRMEAIGNRRVTKLYDAYYKPHASTSEAGRSHLSPEDAEAAIEGAIRESTNHERWQIVETDTGAVISDNWATEEAAREGREFRSLPENYAVREKPKLTRADFQIIPRTEEKWVGPEPRRSTFSVKEQPGAGEGWGENYYEIIIHHPTGENQPFESYGTWAEAQARATQMTEDQLDIEPRTGFPWGEPVHSIDLPTPPEKSWNSFIQYKLGLGEKVTMHDPKALKEFHAWHPESEFERFIASGQPLYGQPLKQRRGTMGLPGMGTVRGSTSPDPRYALRSVVNFTEHGDLTTFVHEVFGHWAVRFLPQAKTKTLVKFGKELADAAPHGRSRSVQTGNFDPALGPLDVEAAEAIAYAMEAYIREGHGPTPVKQAVRSLAPLFREVYDGVDLPDPTPAVRQVFDRMFAYEKVKGGKLVGPEDIPNYSVARVAYEPGRPLPVGVIQNKVAAVQQYILSGGKTIAKGPVDQALNHQYRGAALMSGYFTSNAIRPTTKDALLAVRITTLHRVREDLLKTATDLPSSYTDIAIKVNPDKRTPKGVQTILNKMRELDHAKGGKLTDKDMEQLDFDILEEGSRDVFPNQLQDADGNPEDVRVWAQRALNEQEPIEGIKWIPVEWLDSSGLTPPPGWKGTLSKTMIQGNPALTTWDFINDVNKLAVLYLNPAYVPINLVGNLVMNLMQQGVFAPTNLWKSALMHQWLDGWERKMIDNEMGNGLTASLGTLRGRRANVVNATLGHYANLAVDLIPRRSAWLHEARREGFQTKEQIRELIRLADAGDEDAVERMKLIAYRANDAIVDYERMSPLERAITSRLIFFYPWLKGATRYTLRFGLEHPVQAVALMLAAEHGYNYQKETMGDVPFYSGTSIPIDTKAFGLQVGIPGIYDGKELGDLSRIFGDHKWVQGKYPMVIDARQMLTFSTPLDIYRAAYGLVTGKANNPSFFDNLTPFLTNTITTLQGYDSFRNKEVPVSLETFLRQNVEGLPQVRNWIQLAPASWGGLTDKERREIQERAINPRTSEQDWWRLFGSGLAPAPFSTKVAAQRTLANASTKIRHATELELAAKKYELGPVTDQIKDQLNEYDDMNHEIKSGMTPMESLQVISKYYKRHPELPKADGLDSLIERYATTDARVTHLSDYLRHHLEYKAWKEYWKLRHEINHAERKAAKVTLSG